MAMKVELELHQSLWKVVKDSLQKKLNYISWSSFISSIDVTHSPATSEILIWNLT